MTGAPKGSGPGLGLGAARDGRGPGGNVAAAGAPRLGSPLRDFPSPAVKWRHLPAGSRNPSRRAPPLGFSPSPRRAFAEAAGHLPRCPGGQCPLALEGDGGAARVLQGTGPHLAWCPSTGWCHPAQLQVQPLRDPLEIPPGPGCRWAGMVRTQQSSLFSRHWTDQRCLFSPLRSSGTLQRSIELQR